MQTFMGNRNNKRGCHNWEYSNERQDNVLTTSELIAQLKTSNDIVPDDHNGCYELVRCVVDAYSQRGTEGLDHHDLYLLYVMTLGSDSFNEKKKKIEESNLDAEAKKELIVKLAKVQKDTESGKYDCKKTECLDQGLGLLLGVNQFLCLIRYRDSLNCVFK